MIEHAFVDTTGVELPAGDLNLEALRPWFAGKQFVELTAAVLERPVRPGGRRAQRGRDVQKLTLQQKFPGGVGTNLALDLFVPSEVAEGVRLRVQRLARAFDVKGTGAWTCSGTRWTMPCTCWRSIRCAASPRPLSLLAMARRPWLRCPHGPSSNKSSRPDLTGRRGVPSGPIRPGRMTAPGAARMIRLDDLQASVPRWWCWDRPTPAGTTGSASTRVWSSPADLFVAVRTQRADGHDHVADAWARGATAVVVDHASCVPDGCPGPRGRRHRVAMRHYVPMWSVPGLRGWWR